MLVIIVLSASVLLQFAAAYLAVRLVRITGARRAWLLIAAAVSLMAVRRSITLYHLIAGDPPATHHLPAELVALLISILMVTGIAWIAPLFLSIQASGRALQKSENRYRMLMEQAADGIFVANANGEYLNVNARACELVGYSREELLRLGIRDLIPEEDLASLPPTLDAFETGRTVVFERRLRRKDGGLIPVEISAKKLEEHRFQAIVRDITRRKRSDAELRAQTRGQEVVVELGRRALGGEDLDGLLDSAAEMVAETLDVPYCKVLQLLPEGEAMRVRAGTGWREGCVGSETVPASPHSQAGYTMAQGEPVVVEDFGREERFQSPALLRDHGVVCGISVVIPGRERPFGVLGAHSDAPHEFSRNDVNFLRAVANVLATAIERKEAEDALRLSEEHFRSLIENISDIILVTDADGAIRYGSPSVEKGLGYPPGEILGKPALHLVHPEDADRAERLFAGGSGVTQMRMRAQNGEWRFFEAMGKRPEEPTDHRAVVVSLRDITERRIAEDALRRSEEQLLHSQKMEAVGRLAGGIAHDFNNLLTAIAGYSDLLQRAMKPDDPLRKHVLEIKHASDRAASLTGQLLAFSRKQILQPKRIDLNAVVSGLEKMLGRLIGEHIELVVDPDPALPAVKADPGQIEQVIMNLVVNARDAMPEGGRITVGTRSVEIGPNLREELEPGRYAMLTVRDDGQGMDPETRAHAFDPFFTTKGGEGTGLGLSTVYGIVRQSGGDIEAESAPGAGTTFRIWLPTSAETADETDGNSAIDASPRGAERILLVEDDESVRSLSRRILEMHGYRVLEAARGEEALEICIREQCGIDLVLTDVVMPQMSGRELAGRLADLCPAAKVLYISGYTDGAFTGLAVRDGAEVLLRKPFTPQELARTVREVLDS